MVSTGHPLAKRESVTLGDLVDCAWAASSRQEFARVQIEKAFAKQGYPRMRVVAEANSLAALILIVSTTQLVSFINARSFDPGPCRSTLLCARSSSTACCVRSD
jgi:DNA-binding transcriptional LysR family regulator